MLITCTLDSPEPYTVASDIGALILRWIGLRGFYRGVEDLKRGFRQLEKRLLSHIQRYVRTEHSSAKISQPNHDSPGGPWNSMGQRTIQDVRTARHRTYSDILLDLRFQRRTGNLCCELEATFCVWEKRPI
jgi:hypothetical protein